MFCKMLDKMDGTMITGILVACLLTVIVLGLVGAIAGYNYAITQEAMRNGYEQVYDPGSRTTVWRKTDK